MRLVKRVEGAVGIDLHGHASMPPAVFVTRRLDVVSSATKQGHVVVRCAEQCVAAVARDGPDALGASTLIVVPMKSGESVVVLDDPVLGKRSEANAALTALLLDA